MFEARYVHTRGQNLLQALAFKAIRRLHPDYPLWRDFPYEYVFDKLAIDVINGSPLLREWVDDAEGTFAGGFFSRATRDGCERIVVAHGPDYRDYTTGARCCRDARP